MGPRPLDLESHLLLFLILLYCHFTASRAHHPPHTNASALSKASTRTGETHTHTHPPPPKNNNIDMATAMMSQQCAALNVRASAKLGSRSSGAARPAQLFNNNKVTVNNKSTRCTFGVRAMAEEESSDAFEERLGALRGKRSKRAALTADDKAAKEMGGVEDKAKASKAPPPGQKRKGVRDFTVVGSIEEPSIDWGPETAWRRQTTHSPLSLSLSLSPSLPHSVCACACAFRHLTLRHCVHSPAAASLSSSFVYHRTVRQSRATIVQIIVKRAGQKKMPKNIRR